MFSLDHYRTWKCVIWLDFMPYTQVEKIDLKGQMGFWFDA